MIFKKGDKVRGVINNQIIEDETNFWLDSGEEITKNTYYFLVTECFGERTFSFISSPNIEEKGHFYLCLVYNSQGEVISKEEIHFENQDEKICSFPWEKTK